MNIFNRRHFVATLLAAAATPALAEDKPPIVVFAAASLKNVLDAAGTLFQLATGTEVKISYGGSLALARQIEQGAPADLFLSADEDSMDEAAGKGAIRRDTRVDLLTNALVVVAPVDSAVKALDLSAEAVKAALGDGKLSTGEVGTVPAGKYAKAALTKLGLWDIIEPHLAMSDNVRSALEFVARGEAPLGIVYATDAAEEPKVKVVATFPEETHPRIVYPIALTSDASNPAALKFVTFLRSDAGRKLFESRGFGIAPGGAQ